MDLGPTLIPLNFVSNLYHCLDTKKKNPDISVYLFICLSRCLHSLVALVPIIPMVNSIYTDSALQRHVQGAEVGTKSTDFEYVMNGLC